MAPDDRLSPGAPEAAALADLLHVTAAADWAIAEPRGWVDAESLAGEGFIHCCTPAQLDGVVARYYSDRDDLVVLRLDAGHLGPTLRWEAPAPPDRSTPSAEHLAGAFPHVYGRIDVAAVISAEPLPQR